MDRWDKDEPLSKWWESKSVEKKGNWKRSQAYSLICKAWWRRCHGMSMHGCLWNRSAQLYWWLNVWWQYQNEFGRVQNHLAYQYSRKCHQIHWEVLHIASGQWPKHPASSVKEFIRTKKWKVLDCPSQIEHEFHQLKRRIKAETIGIGCIKGWGKYFKVWDLESGDVYVSQTHCCDCAQGICN